MTKTTKDKGTAPGTKPEAAGILPDVLCNNRSRFLDVLPDAVFSLDAQGRITGANSPAAHLFGWRPEELLGQPASRLMSPSEAERHTAALAAYVPRGHGHVLMRAMPVTARKRDGKLFPAELTVSEIHTETGAGFVGVVHDMTQVVEARRALSQNQERFALALAGTNEGIWDWDVDSGQVFFSERVRDLFKLQKNIGMAADWMNCVHPDDHASYLAALRAHLKGETDFFTIDYRLAGGELRWVRHRGLGLRDPSGRVFRMAGSVGDITEAKLAEVRLQETLAQTESANKAKSDFLSAMSHELRTPLNAIIGFSEMIHSQLLGPVGVAKYGEYAGDILASARHLLDIISDILEMARLEAEQVDFHPEPVDMGAVIDASLRLLHQRISHSGLTLATKIAPYLPAIMGDERRLKQVMINLVGNAIKFTPKGGTILVEAKPVLDGRLLVRVIDSGIGIAERDIPRALTPFTQVDSVVARRYQGSGLGLPLAKSLVELHGGNLQLSSILGRGTTVTLHFPIADHKE